MDSYNKICMIIRKTDLLNHDEKDELHLYLMNLKDQVKKQKEGIDKINKYINTHWVIDNTIKFKNDLFEILEEVSE